MSSKTYQKVSRVIRSYATFQDWIPVTKLGRLVKDGKIKSLEEIYLFSLPIKVRFAFPFLSPVDFGLMSFEHFQGFDNLYDRNFVFTNY